VAAECGHHAPRSQCPTFGKLLVEAVLLPPLAICPDTTESPGPRTLRAWPAGIGPAGSRVDDTLHQGTTSTDRGAAGSPRGVSLSPGSRREAAVPISRSHRRCISSDHIRRSRRLVALRVDHLGRPCRASRKVHAAAPAAGDGGGIMQSPRPLLPHESTQPTWNVVGKRPGLNPGGVPSVWRLDPMEKSETC